MLLAFFLVLFVVACVCNMYERVFYKTEFKKERKKKQNPNLDVEFSQQLSFVGQNQRTVAGRSIAASKTSYVNIVSTFTTG